MLRLQLQLLQLAPLSRCTCSAAARLQRSIHSSSAQLAEPSLSERLAARYAARNAPASTEPDAVPPPIPPRSEIEDLILNSLSLPKTLPPTPPNRKSPTPTPARPPTPREPSRREAPHDGSVRTAPKVERPQVRTTPREQVELDGQEEQVARERERQAHVAREKHRASMRREQAEYDRTIEKRREVALAKERKEQSQRVRQPTRVPSKEPVTLEEREKAARTRWVTERMVPFRAEWRRARIEKEGGDFAYREAKSRWMQPRLLALNEEWQATHPDREPGSPVSTEEKVAKVEWLQAKQLELEAERRDIEVREATAKGAHMLGEQRRLENEWIEQEKDPWRKADELAQAEKGAAPFEGASEVFSSAKQMPQSVEDDGMKKKLRPGAAERAALDRVDRRKAERAAEGLEGGNQSAHSTLKLNYENPDQEQRLKAKQLKRFRDIQDDRSRLDAELAARAELLLPPWEVLSSRKIQVLALRQINATSSQARKGAAILRDAPSSPTASPPAALTSALDDLPPTSIVSSSTVSPSLAVSSSAVEPSTAADSSSSVAALPASPPTPSTAPPTLSKRAEADRESVRVVEEVRERYEKRRLVSREKFRSKWGDEALARADAGEPAMSASGPEPTLPSTSSRPSKSSKLSVASSASTSAPAKQCDDVNGPTFTKDAPPHTSPESSASPRTTSPSPSPTSSTSYRRASPPAPVLPPISSYPSVLSSTSTTLAPFLPSTPPIPIARLAHGLDRVLFNPGVHVLRDPRSGVYNFPTVLENLPKVDEFAFDKLPQYVTSSKDTRLMEIAEGEGRTFVSSTSSTVGMLCQIYFWLSKGREVNTSMLSAEWQTQDRGFSMGQKIPASVVMHYADGRYAIDADKSMDHGIETNILATYGHMMEKLLTTEPEQFSRFLVDSSDPAASEAENRQAYHYTMSEHMVLRSQLDAHNEHLPNRTFDVKTRGSVAIRQDRLNYVEAAGYSVDRLRGYFHSYEREYYDLIRSAFLKYSFQARIGAMDGCLIAYHSTARFFGFQYTPISEMEEAVYGDARLGDFIFKHSVGFLEKILLEAKECYPAESVKLTFAADTADSEDVLRVFVEPVVEDPSRPAVTLLELRGTNYIDGEAQSKVRLPSAFDKNGATWDVGYSIVKHTGLETGDSALDGDKIARLFSDVRDFQSMFNNVTLPIGVDLADYLGAVERAAQEGVEQADEDVALTTRFPVIPGFTYKGSPSKGVRNLRKLAAKGKAEAAEERAAQEGGTRRIVQLKTVVEIREE